MSQEETLQAFPEAKNPGTSRVDEGKRQKKKGSRDMKGMAPRRAPKRFKEYNWTPFNAPSKEVLMEIKKDPEYKKPLPIIGN